jgi:hypothetical protein
MHRTVTHPTKEQVRAYMAAREHAHRPPPSLQEIRGQLGWHLDPSPAGGLAECAILPAALVQFGAQCALDWLLLPIRAQLDTLGPCTAQYTWPWLAPVTAQ